MEERKIRMGLFSRARFRSRLLLVALGATLPALAVLFLIPPSLLHREWLLFTGVFLATLVAAWVGSQQFILQPIQALEAVTTRLAAGDLSARFSLAAGAPGLREMGRAINTMAGSLETRQQQRNAAEAQRRLLAAIIASTEDAVISHTPDGVILTWNAGAEKLFGYTAAEAVGQLLMTIVPDDRAHELPAFLARQRQGEHVEHVETVRRRKDGSLVPISLTLSPLRDEWGQIIGGAGIARDISERVRIETALRTTEERLRFALVTSRVGVWEGQPQADTFYWSDTHEQMHGLPPGTFGGTFAAFLACVHPDDRDAVRTAITQALRERRPADLEYRTVWPDGSEHWIHSTGHYTRDGDGVTVRAAGVAMDVTAQRSLEAQLRQSQKMDAVGQLAGGVAHDFNNMLTAIIGYGEFVLSSLPEGDPNRADVAEIVKAGQRSATLTHQLLAFSRKQLLTPRVLHVADVVTGVTPMLRRLLGETIDLQTTMQDRDRVKADAGQLEQVVLNLAVNARDAMPDGGRLTIDTTDVCLSAEDARRHPDARPGPYVRLSVADTGHGMDAATQQRVFEPFYTTKPTGQGTGLGLATVYGIVRQSDGYIALSSEVGRGTTFQINLPRTDEIAPEARGSASETRPLRGTETILVIEDEGTVREFVVKALTRYGYRVHVAADPQTALDVAEAHSHPIHLVLSDVVLPGMSGPALAAQLVRRHPESLVLYMSAYADAAIVRQAVLETHQWFLPKPFTGEALARKVREVLDAKTDGHDLSRAAPNATGRA